MVRALNLQKVRGRVSHVTTRENDHVTVELFSKKLAFGFEIAPDRLKVGDAIEISVRITDRDYELAKTYYHKPYNLDNDEWRYLEGFTLHINRVWPYELLSRFQEAKEALLKHPEALDKVKDTLNEKFYYGIQI